MKLTSKYLKKLIIKEMKKQTINEGIGTILALLFVNEKLKQRKDRKRKLKQLPVKSSENDYVQSVLVAALILNIIANISGALMEEMDYDMNYESDPRYNEIAAKASEILNLSSDEVIAIIEEFDLMGFYEQNK
tara:strand:- start:90 stop:488 length:399 start_codon:yes stop_codon:yes gene_type:complete